MLVSLPVKMNIAIKRIYLSLPHNPIWAIAG
jgi:hypothetical protein